MLSIWLKNDDLFMSIMTILFFIGLVSIFNPPVKPWLQEFRYLNAREQLNRLLGCFVAAMVTCFLISYTLGAMLMGAVVAVFITMIWQRQNEKDLK